METVLLGLSVVNTFFLIWLMTSPEKKMMNRVHEVLMTSHEVLEENLELQRKIKKMNSPDDK